MEQITEGKTTKNNKVELKQRPFVGYVAWLIQRITAVILLFILPIKIYSGYVSTGQLPGNKVISLLHVNAILDAILIFAVIFHALYGFRVILIDLGVVTDNRNIFKIFTVLGAILCAISFYVIVS